MVHHFFKKKQKKTKTGMRNSISN